MLGVWALLYKESSIACSTDFPELFVAMKIENSLPLEFNGVSVKTQNKIAKAINKAAATTAVAIFLLCFK
jgi:hypothetical protein